MTEEIVIDRYAAIDDGRQPPDDLDAPSRLHRDASGALPPTPDARIDEPWHPTAWDAAPATIETGDSRRHFESRHQQTAGDGDPIVDQQPEHDAIAAEPSQQTESGQTEQAAASQSQSDSAAPHESAASNSDSAAWETTGPESADENAGGPVRPDRLIERMLPLLDEAIAAEPCSGQFDPGDYEETASTAAAPTSSESPTSGGHEAIEPEQRLAADAVRTVLETRQHILEALTDRARRQLDEIGRLERSTDFMSSERPRRTGSETHPPQYDVVEPEPDSTAPTEPSESTSPSTPAPPRSGPERPKRFRHLFTELRRQRESG